MAAKGPSLAAPAGKGGVLGVGPGRCQGPRGKLGAGTGLGAPGALESILGRREEMGVPASRKRPGLLPEYASPFEARALRGRQGLPLPCDGGQAGTAAGRGQEPSALPGVCCWASGGGRPGLVVGVPPGPNEHG